MRKAILLLPVLALLFVILISGSTSKLERKKVFVKSCNESGDKQFTDLKTRKMFHEYCNCAGEKVVNALTEQDWNRVDTLQASGQQDAIAEMITPIIKTCLDDLQRKMRTKK